MDSRDSDTETHTTIEKLGLKYKTEEELFNSLLQADEHWIENEIDLVIVAYQLSRLLHNEQKYRDSPYIYHLLRSANRVTGYLHITDPEIITAVILHDAVEDQPVALIRASFLGKVESLDEITIPKGPQEQQELALWCIEVLFSNRVASMVRAVTNPPVSETESLSIEDKLIKYKEKVKQAIVTEEGWIVKFVDWADNGLGIIHNNPSENPEQYQYRATKYGLVYPVLESRFRQPDIQKMLDTSAKSYVKHQFSLAKERLIIPKNA